MGERAREGSYFDNGDAVASSPYGGGAIKVFGGKNGGSKSSQDMDMVAKSAGNVGGDVDAVCMCVF